MNIVSLDGFRRIFRLNIDKLMTQLPLKISINSEPMFIVAPIDDVVYIGGLHPTMKQQFRARENLARANEPLTDVRAYILKDNTLVYTDPDSGEEIKDETPEVETPITEVK